MTDETMRAAFEDWAASENPRYRKTDDSLLNRHNWKVWQVATLRERERAAVLAAKMAEDLAIEYAGGGPVDFSQIGEAIRKGEAL